MAPSVLRWLHSDSSGLESSVAKGFARAKSGSLWADDEGARRDVRAVLVGTFHAMALLGGKPPSKQDEQTTVIDVRAPAREDDLEWQTALARGVAALASQGGGDVPAFDGTRTVQTSEGKVGASPVNASFGWWGFAAVVTVAGIVAGAAYALISQENEIRYMKLESDVKSAQTVAELAAASEVIERHKQLEQQKGTSLPYDVEELRYLDTLNESVRELTHWKLPPPKTLPNPGDITGGAGRGLEKGIEAALVIAALAIVLN